SEEQAHELVSNMYYDQEITLTEDNHETTEFII
ncbi:MAG: DpnD/PcfM family protein, partial [Enterococcus faecalis]|nr:DpnD/PcfM family protein [Enterococcus faecalis]